MTCSIGVRGVEVLGRGAEEVGLGFEVLGLGVRFVVDDIWEIE